MARTSIHLPPHTRLDEKDIAFLTQTGPSLKLSLYFPFDKTWREPLAEKVLLKDLRRNAAYALQRRGTLSGGIEAILAPVDTLLADTQAFRYEGEGLALFSDGENALAVLLPKAPAPGAQIDLRFRLDGILTQVFGRDRFYLLSLSQQAVKLWDCDGVSIRAVSLEGLETDIRKTPHFQESEYQAVFHSSTASGHGHNSSYAGIGLADGRRLKKEIEVFFRAIDHGIRSRLTAKRQPMVLAGVGFLLPIYRTVNTYAGLFAADLPGNPESSGTSEHLHQRANALLQTAEILERNHALGTYIGNLTRARSCAGYTDLVPCAVQGRLSHLFVAQGVPQWGDFEEADGRTTLFDGYRDGAVDLANMACVNAIRNHAKAYAVPAGEMPAGAPIAGLYRG
ncbi:MAG TPA: hypothetical protein VJ385_08405 [Fibrobacteria bacterium]|nr:hypothetical protein [Fibrobacteria bacterium]